MTVDSSLYFVHIYRTQVPALKVTTIRYFSVVVLGGKCVLVLSAFRGATVEAAVAIDKVELVIFTDVRHVETTSGQLHF